MFPTYDSQLATNTNPNQRAVIYRKIGCGQRRINYGAPAPGPLKRKMNELFWCFVNKNEILK